MKENEGAKIPDNKLSQKKKQLEKQNISITFSRSKDYKTFNRLQIKIFERGWFKSCLLITCVMISLDDSFLLSFNSTIVRWYDGTMVRRNNQIRNKKWKKLCLKTDVRLCLWYYQKMKLNILILLLKSWVYL